MSISSPIVVSVRATSLFCLNVPSKHTRCARSAVGRWQEARGPREPGLMELFYQGSTSHGRYFIFVRTASRRGRHISEATSGKERQDEMESQSTASSHATGATKRPGFCARGSMRRIGRAGAAKGTDRHAKVCWDYLHVSGMGSPTLRPFACSLTWLGVCLRECVQHNADRAQSTCRRTRDYEFFRQNSSLTRIHARFSRTPTYTPVASGSFTNGTR